jgi:MFS family permease
MNIEEYSDEAGRPASAEPTENLLHEELPGASELKHDPYAALRSRDYLLFTVGSLFAGIANQMQNVAVGWDIYQRVSVAVGGEAGVRQGAWALGLVGLIQAIPVILLALPAGQLADRFDRRRIVLLAQLILAFCWAGMAYISFTRGPLEYLYVLLLFDGIANALTNPARTAMIVQLVPMEDIANATTWNSTRWQLSSVVGPALGGAAIAFFGRPGPVYLVAIGGALWLSVFVTLLRPRPQEKTREAMTLDSLLMGARFVWSTPIILATVTLDMFAVLLGGAVALLPVYAKDVLHADASHYGWLVAAPAIGSVVMAFVLAHRRPLQRAGRAMLWAVAGFGAATVVFGVSKNFYLSFVALIATGACDAVSVVVRHTLVQVLTPDRLRGRVSAINSVFIGISNEMGSFESGALARVMGPVGAVVLGGLGTILVTLAVARKWPVVRRIGTLQNVADEFAAREAEESRKVLAAQA